MTSSANTRNVTGMSNMTNMATTLALQIAKPPLRFSIQDDPAVFKRDLLIYFQVLNINQKQQNQLMAAFIEPELVARYQTNSLNIDWQSAFEATFGRTRSLEEDIRDALEFKKDDISVAEYCDKMDKMVDQIMRHKPDRKAIWKMVVAASLNNSDMKKEFLAKKPLDSTDLKKQLQTIEQIQKEMEP